MTYTTVTITLAVLLAIVAVGRIVERLVRKGVNVENAAQTAQKVLDVAGAVTDAAAAVAPGPATYTLQKIVDAAKLGVGGAEQLYLNGSIPADGRKAAAEDVLRRALELDGIVYEGDVAKLGDAAMEAAVRALPKTGEAVKAAAAVQA